MLEDADENRPRREWIAPGPVRIASRFAGYGTAAAVNSLEKPEQPAALQARTR